MKRLIVVILTIVIIGISICGYVIYSTLYMIKPSEPPAPTVFGYSEDYWRGRYSFGFARAETAVQEIVENFIVIMDHSRKLFKL